MVHFGWLSLVASLGGLREGVLRPVLGASQGVVVADGVGSMSGWKERVATCSSSSFPPDGCFSSFSSSSSALSVRTAVGCCRPGACSLRVSALGAEAWLGGARATLVPPGLGGFGWTRILLPSLSSLLSFFLGLLVAGTAAAAAAAETMRGRRRQRKEGSCCFCYENAASGRSIKSVVEHKTFF